MQITSCRISLNGISNAEISGLFSLIKKSKIPVTLSRTSERGYAFTKTDIEITGKFSFEFLKQFSSIFPSPLSLTIDISDHPELLVWFQNYSALQWELDNQIYLGPTIFPIEVMKKIIPVEDNIEFLKLILLTPAASYLKNLLITKPKGAVVFSKKRLHFLLLHQRADFIYLWLDKIISGEPVDFDWISGSTGELPEEYALNTRLPTEVEENFNDWLDIVRRHEIEDYNLVYRKVLRIMTQVK